MKVFFNPKQYKKLYSIPSEKVTNLIEIWSQNPQIQIVPEYELLPKEELYKIHSVKYVNGIYDGTVKNGFNTYDPEMAIVEQYQVSSFLEAAKVALNEGIACSPVAGFHHATYDFSGKFCIFNGLMMTAVKLKELGLAKKIGILDLDFHYGDGTDDIINKLGIKYVSHWGYAKNWVPTAAMFFVELRKGLKSLEDCDIILYQAGMDMYQLDPKGGLLTPEELHRRDKMVFDWAKQMKIPLVWNLAGGYTEVNFLTSLHNGTMDDCLDVYFKK